MLYTDIMKSSKMSSTCPSSTLGLYLKSPMLKMTTSENVVFEALFNDFFLMEKWCSIFEIFLFLYFKPLNQLQNLWHDNDYKHTMSIFYSWYFVYIFWIVHHLQGFIQAILMSVRQNKKPNLLIEFSNSIFIQFYFEAFWH